MTCLPQPSHCLQPEPKVHTCRSQQLGCIVLLGALALSGCGDSGPPVGQVSGKVTFKGEPVTEGTVSFYSAGAVDSGEAQLANDGTYRIESERGGLVVGDYVVSIHPPMELGPPDPRTPQTYVEKNMPNIPKKYRDREKPQLKATVVEGKNVHNFNLE